MYQAKRANLRPKGRRGSSRKKGPAKNETASRSIRANVDATLTTNISSATLKKKKASNMKDKSAKLKEHQLMLKNLLTFKLESVEQELASPMKKEAQEEHQVGEEVIFMASTPNSSARDGGGGSFQNNAKFASLSPILEENENVNKVDEKKKEKNNVDFSNSTLADSLFPQSNEKDEAEEKNLSSTEFDQLGSLLNDDKEESDDDKDESSDGGEQVDGNLMEKEDDNEKDASSKVTLESNIPSSKPSVMATPKMEVRSRKANPSKDGRIKELQAKVKQVEDKLKELQETKEKKVIVDKSKEPSKPSPLDEDYSLTPEQLRVIASDKCCSASSPAPASATSKATIVLDGVHQLPLPRDFNRMPSLQRDLLLVALPEAAREVYLNMAWEARFVEQMTYVPVKAEETPKQELLLSLKF